jgi:hypothetical protein
LEVHVQGNGGHGLAQFSVTVPLTNAVRMKCMAA